MPKWLAWLRNGWKGANTTWRDLRGAPFVAVLLGLCAYLLLGTPQGADLAVTAVASQTSAILLLLAALFYGFECWFWTRYIVEEHVRNVGKPISRVKAWVMEWAPRLLGATPFLVAAIATGLAYQHHFGGEAVWLPPTLAVLTVVMLLGLWLRRRVFGQSARASRLTRWGSLTLALIGLVVFALWPVGPAQALGAIGVVYVGLAMITAVIAWASHLSRKSRLPIIPALLIWAALISLIPFLDIHAVRTIDPVSGQTDVKTAFHTWCQLQSQCKAEAADTATDPSAKPAIPIVFVSAEGGASRAGYWAADVLGDLQDNSPPGDPFSNHVFAISSVSGGSVGALAFLSRLHEGRAGPGQVLKPAQEVTGGDYLSPAIGGMLFPDLVHTVLPLPLPDRARALEMGFEGGWRANCPSPCPDPDLWTQAYMSIWQGNPATLWVPISMVNGARQEDGRRIITSNIVIDPNTFPDAIDFHQLTGRDVRISTAITNGARFPLVSPGGTLIDTDRKREGHVLDGGYFDGGGAISVADLAFAVMNLAHTEKINLRPIFIEISNDNEDGADAIPLKRGGFSPGDTALLGKVKQTHDFLADVLGPLDGLSAARGAHGEMAYMWLSLQALGRYDQPTKQIVRDPLSVWGPNADYVMARLCTPMPMDWALSTDSRQKADSTLKQTKGDACGVWAAITQIRADVAPAKTAPNTASAAK